ncbi:hypothetical protein [Sinorhizobium meliloti]|uniref:hypothetical protein n=1 Tax=Rhizobium meliloti TaxID=382 RepID=UPI001295E054|nr:hypothetical protein [Sinorhizobium meliloti]MDW9491691.1 hypothetical protein [Sinorhizobium meliloti]MQV02957.1 hypothetical protein [Sinorhizobium meliloti]
MNIDPEYKGSMLRIILAVIVVVIIAVFLAGCGVNSQSATRALEAQGMKDVKIEGYSWFGCGKEDSYSSSFSATGANGQPVTGVVCQGFWKGTTVRFD